MQQYEIYEIDEKSFLDFWELTNSGELKPIYLLSIIDMENDSKAVEFACLKYYNNTIALKNKKKFFAALCQVNGVRW